MILLHTRLSKRLLGRLNGPKRPKTHPVFFEGRIPSTDLLLPQCNHPQYNHPQNNPGGLRPLEAVSQNVKMEREALHFFPSPTAQRTNTHTSREMVRPSTITYVTARDRVTRCFSTKSPPLSRGHRIPIKTTVRQDSRV